MALFVYRYDSDCAYVPEDDSYRKNVTGPGSWHTFGIAFDGNVQRQLGYDEVETALSREEYEKALEEGVTGDLIYSLSSDAAQAFADEIREDELVVMENDFSIPESDARFLVDTYYQYTGNAYWDRNIVASMFLDWQEAAEEKAWSWGMIENGNDRYFDYDAFIEDLQEDGAFIELPESGKVAYLME